MLKHAYQHHPAFERSCRPAAVSQASSSKPSWRLWRPTVRTKARFMNVHRLFTWAERLLTLSPPGRGQGRLDLSPSAGVYQ